MNDVLLNTRTQRDGSYKKDRCVVTVLSRLAQNEREISPFLSTC